MIDHAGLRGARTSSVVALVVAALAAWIGHAVSARAAEAVSTPVGPSFEDGLQPFIASTCLPCHNETVALSGIRLDVLDGSLPDRRMRLWEAIHRHLRDGSMPPEGAPQPTKSDRSAAVAWIERALDFARSRPTPKNGSVRRLTVAQYRNTIRDLLHLEDDLTDILPPDAVSEDGFVNNAETLEFSPLLMEAYFDIASEALGHAIVDPDTKPDIQRFRVDLGRALNPTPLPVKLILGANSQLLDDADYVIEEPVPEKEFPFEHRRMRTKYRFHEGYKGNATVRGWRDYDSLYHAVFAGMRGSKGYPKGTPYTTVPEGLLLRPAIPTDEIFRSEGTYGPKANFKISVRELPDYGRFRVTVHAARYDDGLLLDKGDGPQDPAGPKAIVLAEPGEARPVTIERGGVYQVDVHEGSRPVPPPPSPATDLMRDLSGTWPRDESEAIRRHGGASVVDSPLGEAVSLQGTGDWVSLEARPSMDVGEGDFTVAAWIRPEKLQRSGIVALGSHEWARGWYFELADQRGALGIGALGPDLTSAGSVVSPLRMIKAKKWQHVAAVVRRGKGGTQLYVNGYPMATGSLDAENLGNLDLDLQIGRVGDTPNFVGEIADARLYRRALEPAELQTLVEPGRRFVEPPPDKPQEVSLSLGKREFARTLDRPAFVALRLPAGPLEVGVVRNGPRPIEQVVLTPLPEDHEIRDRFEAFEARVPRLGVHLGLRRDCGSTFAPVGKAQPVHSDEISKFVFEGAIRDYPSPDVEEDNVNYLAGIREIAVRSEHTDGRDMPRLLVRSVEFEGPFYESWPPRSHQSIFVESGRRSDGEAYAREIIRSFAARAFRRPARPQEETALLGAYRQAFDGRAGFRESIADALRVALTSPQFLLLVESSETPEAEPIEETELASKLSYFLWNGPPDQRTRNLAEQGALRGQLTEEVDRMIADPRFSEFAQQFTSQWLALDKFDVLEPDRERFPLLTREARVNLRQEPVELLQYLIRHNLPASNFVESDFLMANEVVASYYGLGEMVESGLEFVAVPHGRPELGGLLSQAAVMAGLSDGRESNPVKRGAWVARKIVAEPPDPPPPNVPDLSLETEGLSLRKRLEMHRNQPGCAECHKKIDPWGVPFEEIDAAGRFKAEQVDAASALPDGTEIAGVRELKRYLADDRIDQVAFSVLKHLLTYANGRTLKYNELRQLKRDALALAPGGYRMRDMVHHVVASDLFLEN